MSKKKLLRAKLIANPGAGDASDHTARLQQVTRSLLDCGIKLDVALAKPKKEATPIAQKAVKAGYKLIIAMGGDGTIEAVMRGMVGSQARMGIIPAGTANNIARSLNIPLDLEEACTLVASDQTRKLDICQVKRKGKGKFYFFELAAVGLIAALYPDSVEIPKGNLSKLKDVAAKLLHYDTKAKVYLTLDGESKVKLETMLVTLSNTPQFGLNFLIAPAASLEDGLLDVSTFPDFSKAEILAYYARVRNENMVEDERIQRFRARKIKIKTDPKLDIMADGVLLGKGTVRMKVLPQALRVIAPEAEPARLEQVEQEQGQPLPAPVSPVVVST